MAADSEFFSRLWRSSSRPHARLRPKLTLSIQHRFQLTLVYWKSHAHRLALCCAVVSRYYPAKLPWNAGQPALPM